MTIIVLMQTGDYIFYSDDYCKIKADVVVLVQDSSEISEKTIKNIKSTVKGLLSALESSDPAASYNFALAMYAKRQLMSPFGSKDEIIRHMDGELNKGKEGRLLGSGNLLDSALNTIKESLNSRPKDTKKVSVS